MEGLLWFLIIGALFYFMMRVGCGGHKGHGHSHGCGGGHGSHAGHEGDDGIAQEEQKDPVCGMTVSPDQGYSKGHQGKPYRFCSRDCLDKFEAEPDKYLQATSGEKGGTA
ncbi:MAG: YHS domain-containing protein [Thiobacillus sp.]|jgi:YHS domain-containing protein|nr:YHS domain-containing protein [Thiobacillus sp.]